MSGRAVSRVLDADLPPDLKFTLAVFASCAADDGVCWPAIGHVAHLRGVSERAVQYHVKELRQMEILAVVKPATQWWPAHYRIVFDRLPARAPYAPPDRQLWLGPAGESPPVENLGVKCASPPPGVKYSAPGVKPTSPDPSPDPYTTHTYVHAREAEVQPTAPLTSAPAGESPLPLIVAPRRDPDHGAHAWCGRICVPKFLHKQFKRALGGPVTLRADRLRTFYAETLAAMPAAAPIGDEPVKFWRRALAARFGGVADEMRLSRHEIADAEIILTRVGYCRHEPGCADRAACVRKIALARKVG